jgi:hypothetical protein
MIFLRLPGTDRLFAIAIPIDHSNARSVEIWFLKRCRQAESPSTINCNETHCANHRTLNAAIASSRVAA